MKYIFKKLMLFILCGIIYCSIELLWRGYTHVSMFMLTGLLGVFCIDTPNNIYGYDLDYLIQIIISTIFCTFGEGICGLIVNVWLKLSIWDYSNLFGTFFFGQCNIFFVFAWMAIIGLFGIFFCDAYNYYICKDNEQPYYKIFKHEFLRFPIRKE